jgi:hypothetical protein
VKIMLDHDYQVRLQLSRDRAAELARDYQRAQKLESRSADAAGKRAGILAIPLSRRRRRAARQAAQA